jgi:hypothetical protein
LTALKAQSLRFSRVRARGAAGAAIHGTCQQEFRLSNLTRFEREFLPDSLRRVYP